MTPARSLLTRAALGLTLSAIGAAPAPGQSCGPHWADDLYGADPPGEVQAMTVFDDGSGPALYVGTAGSQGEGAVARWDGARLEVLWGVTGWLPGASFSQGVYALTGFDDGTGPALYIGGSFTAVNGTPASGVAKRVGDGWEPLGTGTSGPVHALQVYDDGTGPALYAAGAFQQAGGIGASCVAKWDGRHWSAMGSGLSGGQGSICSGGCGYFNYPILITGAPIGLAMRVFDDGTGPALYVGGNFDHAGGAPAASIARWYGSAWSPVGNGLTWNNEQGAVLALEVFDGVAGPSLYAGGLTNFGALNENPIVARWDGLSWHPVASWLPGDYIASLTVADHMGIPSLYAGIHPNAQGQNTVFRLDGSAWTVIGHSAFVRALAPFEHAGVSMLYAGGLFQQISAVPAPGIARWDGAHWSALPYGGALDTVYHLKTVNFVDGPRLYAWGPTAIGGQAIPQLGRFDGAGWSPVGASVLGGIGDVEAFDGGDGMMLYTAGFFYGYGLGDVLARLNGGTWEVVAAAPPVSHMRLKAFDDGTGPKLFAGGWFSGGIRVWDGQAWTNPGGGLPIGPGFGWHAPSDFEVFDGGGRARLYVSWGLGVSRWTGSGWELVPCPFPVDYLTDMAVFDDGTGAALYFVTHTGTPVNPILRYDGQAWTALAGTLDGYVGRLAVFDDSSGPALYATGYFTAIGGVHANRIARWRDGEWSDVGGGVNDQVWTAAVFHLPQPALWLGGDFTTAGGLSSSHLARWVGCPSCYPDCDQGGTLTAADFTCFQTKFAAADPYADCNQSGGLTVADFTCFQTQFVAGCP